MTWWEKRVFSLAMKDLDILTALGKPGAVWYFEAKASGLRLRTHMSH